MTNSPARILIVDTDPAALESTARVLRSAGWQVISALSGEAALDAAAPGIDLALIADRLPDMDGSEVRRRIRGLAGASRTPVIHVAMAFNDEAVDLHGRSSDADGFLTLPVEPVVLASTVHAFLRAAEAETQSLQDAAKFEAVFQNAPYGIALLSPGLACLDVNPEMARLLGESSQSLIGRSLASLVTSRGRPLAEELTELRPEQSAWQGALSIQRPDGVRWELEWSFTPLPAQAGWLATVMDAPDRRDFERQRDELLTSERAARAEAERANRLKDDFLATLSHELRTPLNAIVGWSELLKLGRLDEEEAREGIDAIERNAKAQAQMIADLLDVSRITSGKLRLEVQTVDPATTVEAALAVVAPAAEAKGVTLDATLDPHAGPVAGDPARLQQVIWNLVNNAVKFTPKGGRIDLSLRRVESRVEIAVADTGQGIAPDLLPYVFERFRQGGGATTRPHGGLGLGLAIVKQLVEMHGGTVRAESPGTNQGATFTVVLPVASVRPTQESAAERGISTAGSHAALGTTPLQGVRVMVVDDDDDARRLTRRVLTESGAESQEAASVEEAVAVIGRFSPHVLISDLGMPGQDGFDLIRQVRSRGYTFHDLPAVALTAFARTEDRRRALLAGFQVHLAKPVDPNELTATVATLVGRTGA